MRYALHIDDMTSHSMVQSLYMQELVFCNVRIACRQLRLRCLGRMQLVCSNSHTVLVKQFNSCSKT